MEDGTPLEDDERRDLSEWTAVVDRLDDGESSEVKPATDDPFAMLEEMLGGANKKCVAIRTDPPAIAQPLIGALMQSIFAQLLQNEPVHQMLLLRN
eukprot:COSAG04_NODE_421_length_14620_cov_14.314648_3_plen_96_part_00